MPGNARRIVESLIAQTIWVALVAASSLTLVFVFGTADVGRILGARLSVPAWMILLFALIVLLAGIYLAVVTRRFSAVRGRLDATQGNVALLQERGKIDVNARIVRSTRLGRWSPTERLPARSMFRDELDKAIVEEGADVRRIWNVSSLDHVRRLTAILDKYEGRANHSIRVYFDLPDHVLPELLVVDGRGASMSFPSTRTPHDLDWMIRFNRKDLIVVVRDYFDVLWDRAERILDAGDITEAGRQRLRELEQRLGGTDSPAPG